VTRGKKVIFSEQDINRIIDLYLNTSNSTRDIAKVYGCAYNTINNLLKNNNVSMQGKSKITAKSIGNTYRVGYKASEETKLKNSIAMKHRSPTTLDKVYTEQERQNISNGVKKAFLLNPTQRVKQAREVGVDKIIKARSKCKNLLRRVLKLTGNKKATKTYNALGYTEKELLAHIAAQFKEGMSWESRESFHIDHIIPITWHIKNGITDPKIINALSNLQPLYPEENRKKADKCEVLTAHFGKGKTSYTKGI
jgi:hypothetical protein